MSRSDIDQVYAEYDKYAKKISNRAIEGLVVRDFFRPYYSFSQSCQEFFGKAAKDLSQNQISMLYLSGVFKSIFENRKINAFHY